MSTTDRTSALYARRRIAGLCVRCGDPSEHVRCERCRARDRARRKGAYSADAIMGTDRARRDA